MNRLSGLLTIPALACLLVASAGATEYAQVVAGQGRVSFVSKQMGVPVEGEFKRFTAEVNFDPARPEAARAQLDIDLASIDVGNREVYEEVIGKNWFNVRQFPRARFQSATVRALGGNRYEVRGTLSIKGRSREVAAPFSFGVAGQNGVFDGGFVLKRLDFGIGEGPWGDPDAVADEIQVKFRVLAAPTAPAKPTKAGRAKPARQD